jgi:2-methylcitrate dehydratase PrpD
MAGYDPELGNSVFFEKGFHATSIYGTLGAALAAAMLYGLDEEAVANAVAISASMGAGIIEANRTGGTVKRVHCGWAAQSGIVAAELAARGLTGPPTVFEGRFGLLRAYLDEDADPGAITRGLGEEWERYLLEEGALLGDKHTAFDVGEEHPHGYALYIFTQRALQLLEG